jgi:hypothetical protein
MHKEYKIIYISLCMLNARANGKLHALVAQLPKYGE